MLVRFLSYAASIIGARRYKPVLISCLALIFSITCIGIVASAISSSSPDAASRVTASNKKKTGQQPSSTSLNGLQQQPTKDSQAIQNQNGQAGTATDQKQSNGATTPVTNNTDFDISLNTAMISLNQASPNAAVTVSTSDGSIVQWTITPDASSAGLTSRIDPAKDTPGNAVIRFRAEAITPGTYQFTVTAKDANRSVSASKTLTVTVN
jgi:hypothetical protein